MSDTEVRSQGASTVVAQGAGEPKLPRRDWILMPVLGLSTICLLVFSTEWVAGRIFRISQSSTLSCLILNDPSTGVRAIPNSVCSEKTYESQLVEYRFNGCGHRAGMECGPKPPGTYRIVMVGSSFNFGMRVPREKSFAALLPAELSRRMGRKVELYNEAMQWETPTIVSLRFHQVFAEAPDMILWVLTPMDIGNVSVVLPYVPPQDPVATGEMKAKELDRMRAALASHSIKDSVLFLWNHAVVALWNRRLDAFKGSPSGIMLQHVLYASQSLYLKSSLTVPDSEGGGRKVELSPEWRSNLRQFDQEVARIEEQTRAAGVPLVATLVPDRAQAAMLSFGEWPQGYDPYNLDRQLRAIIVSHGGTYFDILPDLSKIPNPEQHYFPVDGHPDSEGHAMISSLLAKEMTGGAIPALGVVAQQQPSLARGR